MLILHVLLDAFLGGRWHHGRMTAVGVIVIIMVGIIMIIIIGGDGRRTLGQTAKSRSNLRDVNIGRHSLQGLQYFGLAIVLLIIISIITIITIIMIHMMIHLNLLLQTQDSYQTVHPGLKTRIDNEFKRRTNVFGQIIGMCTHIFPQSDWIGNVTIE